MADRRLDERTIFLRALELTEARVRAAFLDEECRNDQELRRGVEALLKAHEGACVWLDAPDGAPPTADRLPGPEGLGAVIGPYRLMEAIGEGGMGVVYVAEQREPVRRTVALKVIKPGMDSRQVVARFEVERQALAMMDHSNIAKVLDAGTTDSGRPYFVMELVRGLPITDYCDREQLPIAARLDLFVLVCRAVQHAHQKGIIHRDLKPSNVLVTLHDGVPVPKVIDFGVAKAVAPGLTDKTVYTEFTQLIGTPLYMSPEQAEGSGLNVDTRSDIYSLGVLLYELLTGTTPFDSETLKKAAFDEMRRIIREEEPQKPSLRLSSLGETLTTVSTRRGSDPQQLNRTVRGELDWIVMKALEKDRTQRYGTPNHFADDLIRYLTGQPVEACPPSRVYHLQKFVRRNRSRIAAMGLIGTLGVALAAVVGGQAVERAARWAETVSAATQAVNAAEAWARLGKWPEAMAAVNQAGALLGPGGGEGVLRERTRRLRDDLAMVLRLDQIRQQISGVHGDHFDTGLGDRWYGEAFQDYGIDVDSLEPADVASKMPAGPVREELIAALDDWMRIRRGKHKKNGSDWKRLLAAARAADPDPWRNQVREAWLRDDRKALSGLSNTAPFDRLHPCDVLLLEANLDNVQAMAVLREALRRRPGDFWLNHALGVRLITLSPPWFEEAVGYFRAAAAVRPESPGAILNVGYVMQKTGRTDEAIAAFEQAIHLKPDYAMAYSNYGDALSDAGRFDDAVRACREAIRLNPNNATAHANLGRALTQAGAPDEAIPALREALRLEPGNSEAARQLALACFKKVVACLQLVHRSINRYVVRLPSPRPFMQTLLDPRSLSMRRRHFVLSFLAAGVLASPAFALKTPRYVFTSFDVPGAIATDGNDVNNGGTIVGYFNDANNAFHGFLLSGGAYTQIDVPGASKTISQGINDLGTIVGQYDDAHGFVLSGGIFTSIDVAGAAATFGGGINHAGDIVGKYLDVAGNMHGFLLSGGQFTTIDFPNATAGRCWGINNNGQIVGEYQDASGTTHGYLLTGGNFTSLTYPKAIYTQAIGINNNGQIVGRYRLSDGVNHGFLLSSGTYTAINYPNSTWTDVRGINDSGEISGHWQDAANVSHGFYAVPQ